MTEEFEKMVSCTLTESFLQLLMTNHSRIYAYIMCSLSNTSDADDIMQNITMIMWRKFDQFQLGTNFLAWAITIARNDILTFRRNKAKEMVFSDNLLGIIHGEYCQRSGLVDAKLDALSECVEKLSELDKKLISGRYEDNLTINDLADSFDKTSSSIFRALTRVHGILVRCVRRKLNVEPEI